MLLFFLFILISITPLSLHAEKKSYPSFRSSVITDGKPILRGGGPEEDEEQEKLETDKIEEDINGTKDESRKSKAVDDLSVLIDWLIDKYGYQIAKQTRRADNNSSGPLKDEFRSHSKKRKSKKNKRKGPHGKNKERSYKKNEMEDLSRERDTKTNTENENVDLSGENVGKENNNNGNWETRNDEVSNTETVKFHEEAENRENDDYKINDFGENLNNMKEDDSNNDNGNDDSRVTSINLMDIVSMIRDKIGSYGPKAEISPPEPLRMPHDINDDDSNNNKRKKNFSIALSVQV